MHHRRPAVLYLVLVSVDGAPNTVMIKYKEGHRDHDPPNKRSGSSRGV